MRTFRTSKVSSSLLSLLSLLSLIPLLISDLLSKMQQLESTMGTTDKAASQQIGQITLVDSPPTLSNVYRPSNSSRTSSDQKQAPNNSYDAVPESAPSARRKPARQTIPAARATTAGHISPPALTGAQSSHQPDIPSALDRPELSPARSVSGTSQLPSSSVSPQPMFRSWAQLAQQNSRAWVSICLNISCRNSSRFK